jgi:hypothetical protein
MWTDKLGPCFADYKFGKEKSERDHAKDVMREAADDGMNKEQFQKEILWYLYHEGLDDSMLAGRMRLAMNAIDKMWKSTE